MRSSFLDTVGFLHPSLTVRPHASYAAEHQRCLNQSLAVERGCHTGRLPSSCPLPNMALPGRMQARALLCAGPGLFLAPPLQLETAMTCVTPLRPPTRPSSGESGRCGCAVIVTCTCAPPTKGLLPSLCWCQCSVGVGVGFVSVSATVQYHCSVHVLPVSLQCEQNCQSHCCVRVPVLLSV
jgi:hypothetical protein